MMNTWLIRREVSGCLSVVVPDLESGNMLTKNLAYLAKADSVRLVLGARVPIVVTSRTDSRMASCAAASILAQARCKSTLLPAA